MTRVGQTDGAPLLAVTEAALLHRAEERWLDTARARLRAAGPRPRRRGDRLEGREVAR
ncbi:hypothetical protein [Nocardioides ferulae]|uniref:hypothetical protein n=1 Tax=Nocardioides ferulae TaxID=2340821 RepID=UPI0013DE19C6|nr:hypothetical protein [Nocardioides ferulae]